MLKFDNHKIPYSVNELTYSDYLDYTLVKPSKDNPYDDVEVLTGTKWDFDFLDLSKDNVANILRTKVANYNPQIIDNFVHNDELFIVPKLNDIELLEGVFALNYMKYYSKPKETELEQIQQMFALKLYLIATFCRKVVDGVVEQFPTDLGETYDFVNNRVNELTNISFKNATDFDYFLMLFNDKMNDGIYQFAFNDMHGTETDNKTRERNIRYRSVYGTLGIVEHLLSNNLINDLKTPFFHSIALYGMSINK